MKFGIFVLVQSFIRVDSVIFRSLETRYFLDASTNAMLKEVRRKEDSFENIVKVEPIVIFT